MINKRFDEVINNASGDFIYNTFDYNIDGLLTSFTESTGSYVGDKDCVDGLLGTGPLKEWQYKYSPTKEREQKRLYKDPSPDKDGNAYGWVYYLLDGTTKPLAVYHGVQLSDPIITPHFGTTDIINPLYPTADTVYPTADTVWIYPPSGTIKTTQSMVYMMPVEYNIFGATGNELSWQYDEGVNEWKPVVNIKDRLGSVRSVVTGFDASSAKVIGEYDYHPFGKQVPIKDSKTRLDYIDKETDTESNLGDYGVRKYDSFTGRFITPDRDASLLFEKYAGWSPYQYSLDNPVSYKDLNGKDVTALDLQYREDILNSLPNQIRGQIAFSDAGLIDRQSINSINSDDGNFLALTSLVNNDKMIYVENREDIVIQDMNGDGNNDLIPMEKAIKGFTATPTSPDGKYLSIYDNIIHVQININSSSKTRAKYIGHELYGHALFYNLGKNYEHDYQGGVDQNTELKLFIFDREKNSEDNYENK